MIYLFEGLDKVGKTTIAKALSKKINFPYFKDNRDKKWLEDYSPELSIVYEEPRLLQLHKIGIYNNLIIDRGFVSEYAYGPVFRKEAYDKYNCEEKIFEISKEYFIESDSLITVYCYKDNYEDDDVFKFTLEQKKQIEERYNYFLSRVPNKVIYLNTTNKTVEENLEEIQRQYKILMQLDWSSEAIYSHSKENKVFFPGIFNGNEVLFIGQNPGKPTCQNTDEIHKKVYDNYNEFSYNHYESYYNSKFWKWLVNFSKQWVIHSKQFSFTNLVKFSTKDNRQPLLHEIKECEEMLLKQISLLNPKKIVSFGKLAHIVLSNNKIEHEAFYHPAKYNYTKTEKI